MPAPTGRKRRLKPKTCQPSRGPGRRLRVPGAGATDTPPRVGWGGLGRQRGGAVPSRSAGRGCAEGGSASPAEGTARRGRLLAGTPGDGRSAGRRVGQLEEVGRGSQGKKLGFPALHPRARGCDGCRRAQSGQGRNCVNLSRWEGAKGHRSLTTSAKWSLQQSKIKPESLSPFSRSENKSGGSLGLGMRRGEGTAQAGQGGPGPEAAQPGAVGPATQPQWLPAGGRAPGREATPPGARPEPGRTRLPTRGARRPRSGESCGRGQVTPKPLPF